MRAVIELLFTVLVILVARAVLTSLVKGISKAANNPGATPRQPNRAASETNRSGELHKDPVCGTYVAESTPYQRRAGGQGFYYCSEACREKHALVAR